MKFFKNIFVSGAKITRQIEKTISEFKKKTKIENEKSLDDLATQLEEEFLIKLSAKDAEIGVLNKEILSMEKELARTRDLYYRVKRDAKENENIAVGMKQDAKHAIKCIQEAMQILLSISEKAKRHYREINNREEKDLAKIGFKKQGVRNG